MTSGNEMYGRTVFSSEESQKEMEKFVIDTITRALAEPARMESDNAFLVMALKMFIDAHIARNYGQTKDKKEQAHE